MRTKAKIDLNQPDIVKALRDIPHVSVHSTAALGKGFPDLCVGYRGKTYLFEIKNPALVPSKQRLTPDETTWHSDWFGHVAIVTTADQILDHIGVRYA